MKALMFLFLALALEIAFLTFGWFHDVRSGLGDFAIAHSHQIAISAFWIFLLGAGAAFIGSKVQSKRRRP